MSAASGQDARMIRRPTAALLGLAGIVCLGLALAIAPWLAGKALDLGNLGRQEILADLDLNLARLLQRRELGGDQAALEAAAQRQPIFLPGDTTGIAGALLQQRLTELLDAAGVKADSFRVLEPVDQGSMRRIGIVVTARFDTKSLRNFIFDVETSRPLLLIDAMQVRSEVPTTTKGGKEQLAGSIEVHGFMNAQGDT